jgi:hypothetical protein
VWTVKTDEGGRAQFDSLPASVMVHAVAEVTGEHLESQEFPVPARGGIRLMLVATPAGDTSAGAAETATPKPQPGKVRLGGDSRIVIEDADGSLRVFYLFEIVNPTGGPITTGPLVFAMPADAQGTTVLQSTTAKATANGSRVTVTGPFEPGRTSLEIAFELPTPGGQATFAQQVPADLAQLAVIAQKTASGTKLASANLAEQREMSSDGRVYLVATGPRVAEGGTVQLTLSGLPYHSPAPRYVALALAVLILMAGLWVAFAPGRQGAVQERRKLESRRELLFRHLVTLEGQHQSGTIDRKRYAARRGELMAQLERVFGALDEERAA